MTKSLYDDKGVRKIMERHDYTNKIFRDQEFSRKFCLFLFGFRAERLAENTIAFDKTCTSVEVIERCEVQPDC